MALAAFLAQLRASSSDSLPNTLHFPVEHTWTEAVGSRCRIMSVWSLQGVYSAWRREKASRLRLIAQPVLKQQMRRNTSSVNPEGSDLVGSGRGATVRGRSISSPGSAAESSCHFTTVARAEGPLEPSMSPKKSSMGDSAGGTWCTEELEAMVPAPKRSSSPKVDAFGRGIKRSEGAR
eukprot:CAMPEP_0194512788 /NCGR_PEP_ID=MMETSP0253-20130528/44911_1 /TAXON_ID=2966 /ORGANISM="Noctiluca scintillans" /LENGTH=177 /DNA_ID=CAMNT_0039356283 /DNA_START=664 /DNA_END=1193 /DNA_ORIENTATION=+